MIRFFLTILVATSAFFSAEIVFAQSVHSVGSVVDFDADSPRLLDEALKEIEERLRVPVNYQEAIISNPADLVRGEDIGLAQGKRYQKSHHLKVHYVPGESDALSAAQTAVNAYQEARLPGLYKVVSRGSAIHVIPTRDGSLFDTKVTWTAEGKNLADLLESLSAQISRACGKQIVLLNQPNPMDTKAAIFAQDEPLWKIFEQVTQLFGPTSFRFVYEPSTDRYYLNVNGVATLRPDDLGEKASTTSSEKSRAPSSPFFVRTPQ